MRSPIVTVVLAMMAALLSLGLTSAASAEVVTGIHGQLRGSNGETIEARVAAQSATGGGDYYEGYTEEGFFELALSQDSYVVYVDVYTDGYESGWIGTNNKLTYDKDEARQFAVVDGVSFDADVITPPRR